MSVTGTIALLRLSFIVAWAFYALFEKSPSRLVWALAIALVAGNLTAVFFSEYAGAFGK